jgi:lactoylglutathione lyase
LKINGVAHIGIECKDLEESLNFYCGILGFEQITDNARDKGAKASYFLKHGGVVVELLLRPESETAGRWGVINHLSMSVDDVKAAREELKAKGIEFETMDILYDPYLYERGEYYVSFRGPNGERLQLEQIL